METRTDRAAPADSARPAAPRARWRAGLRNAVSISPLVVVYPALVAIPFIDLDPWSFALAPAVALVIGLGITAGFHRYFSHRSFKTSRAVQFVLGVAGCLALQDGPLWWTAYHRVHHKHADADRDPHSPVRRGFWHAHFGWMFSREPVANAEGLVKDLAKYPELVWLDRLWMVPGLLFGLGCYLVLGWSGVIVGYCLAVGYVYQVTFAVNSVGHLFGRQRFRTGDKSRNNLALGYLGLGEGWHNNHHHAPYSARHGLAWYEFDSTYMFLRLLAWLGLVWDLKLPPPELMTGAAHVDPHDEGAPVAPPDAPEAVVPPAAV